MEEVLNYYPQSRVILMCPNHIITTVMRFQRTALVLLLIVIHTATTVHAIDSDGDGVEDEIDLFPDDPYEWEDFDSDGVGDNMDPDDDNDGVNDTADAYPNNPGESVDNDGDGTGDNADLDDDTCPTSMVCRQGFYPGDGILDSIEEDCNTDPNDPASVPGDSDGDGICDHMDLDHDNDGVNDENDPFPGDPCAFFDTDEDGAPDFTLMDCDTDLQEDGDDDGDGHPDEVDAFPLDGTEHSDLDSDGVGDIADLDDDGDGWTDEMETKCGTYSTNPTSVPPDLDMDSICDELDIDVDGDGFPDDGDEFPLDAAEWSDLDGDGVGDNQDGDDDDDGWPDKTEVECEYKPDDPESTPPDSDGDGICDYLDPSPLDEIQENGLPGIGLFALLSCFLIAAVAVRRGS